MMSEDRQDRLDPRLAAAYQELRDEQAPDVDWEKLRSAIRRRAAPELRRREGYRFASMGRPLIPLAAAAGIAFALWVGPRVLTDRPGSATLADFQSQLDEESALVELLLSDLSEQEFRSVVSGNADPDALLAVAVGQP